MLSSYRFVTETTTELDGMTFDIDPSQAAVVTVRNGQPAVTDGPFLEAKEHLGGFYLIDCEDKDRAIELAAQIPDAAIEGLGVEVRQVMFADGQLEA